MAAGPVNKDPKRVDDREIAPIGNMARISGIFGSGMIHADSRGGGGAPE
jgi:hypothetical protein